MIKYDSNICILNSKGSNDSAVHRDRQSRVAAVVIREPSPLQGVHARELDLGESCKRVSAVHLPFCFLNHKYAREKEKRRDTRRRGEERREREEGLVEGGTVQHRIFCSFMRNRHVVDIVRDLPLPVAEPGLGFG